MVRKSKRLAERIILPRRRIECDIELPKGVAMEIDGKNGKIEVDRPSASTVVKLSNGKVALGAEAGKKYRYNLHVSLGTIDPRFDTAAKGGVVTLMRAVAAEEKSHGVRANALAPLAIRTAENLASMGSEHQYVERETIAAWVLWLSTRASAINGQVIRLG